jgi:hypothetical protein
MTRFNPPGRAGNDRPPQNKGSSRAARMGIFLAVVVIAGFGLLKFVLLPRLEHTREQAIRALCASNMKNIAAALTTYSNANNGQYPDSLATLVRKTGLPPRLLICPDSPDTPLPNPAAATGDAALAGHNSYIYLGGGKTISTFGDLPILYEAAGSHHGEGMNVMYADYSVEWLDAAKTRDMLQKLSATGK